MDKPVKSGKEILDDFFNGILTIPNVEEKLASEIKKMYEEGKLTNTNLSNKLTSFGHLSSDEIDRRGGLTALRNTFITDTEKSSVEINFTDGSLASQKNISLRKSNPEVKNSNISDAFVKYVESSKNENLILRYENLTRFVLSSKKEKLDSLSEVIGFTKISEIRSVLKKAANDIGKSLKSKNYDNDISSRQGQIMESLNEPVLSDDQYLFLPSVKAFNKENHFFILDDIISSFDSNHRKRLSDLLIEKFSDYQIFVMTHERNWFDYMKNLVRGRVDWIINVINWNESKGTHLNETLVDQKRIIEQKLADNDKTGLGNLKNNFIYFCCK